MKLGIMIEGQEGLTWEAWRRIIGTVERLGFESLWLSDHISSIVDPARQSIETWVGLTLAAAESKRIRFGSLVSPMTFRHPAMLARTAAAVDVLSSGRLVLGVGAGWNEVEHRSLGIPFPPLQERMDILEEGIEVLTGLFSDAPCNFGGRHFQLENADPRPKPIQRPRVPILIGGTGQRRTLRIVARYADEWDAQGAIVPKLYRARSKLLAEHCREIGRDPSQIRRCVSTAYLVGRNTADLQRRARRMQELVPSIGGVSPAAALDALRSSGWLIGTAEEMVTALQALADEGVHRVMLQHNDHTDFDALELMAADVIPCLETPGGAGWS